MTIIALLPAINHNRLTIIALLPQLIQEMTIITLLPAINPDNPRNDYNRLAASN